MGGGAGTAMGSAGRLTPAEAIRSLGPGVSCYMPANGETVTLPTSPSIPVGISLGLLKREMAQGTWARTLGGAERRACAVDLRPL